jgi:multidrug efflux pump subunit AcrA (membrane-fusion protein)
VLVVALAGVGAYRAAMPGAVDVVDVAHGSVPVRVTGPGTVQARVNATLSARVTASVVTLGADQGDRVRAGQMLAVLDDRDLAARKAVTLAQQETLRRNIDAAQASLAKADAELRLARSRHRRDGDLVAKGYVSQAAMDASTAALHTAEASVDNARAALAARESEMRSLAHELRIAEAVLSHAHVAAPIGGIVIQRSVEVGNTVVPGSPLFRLADPASLWVTMRVDEAMLARLAEGQKAALTLRSGESLAGKVARIALQSDAATRELDVDIAFDTPPQRFAIDQEAQVSIEAGEESGVVVPPGAIVQQRGAQYVLVVREGQAQLQAVTTGASDAQRVVVRAGLAAGDTVVARPAGVKPGARVR